MEFLSVIPAGMGFTTENMSNVHPTIAENLIRHVFEMARLYGDHERDKWMVVHREP